MKIALLGYGKMGHAIEAIAAARGHEAVARISIDNLEELTVDNLRRADVAIEFTGPDSAAGNLQMCFDAGLPVVCGSTGWLAAFEEIRKYCLAANGALLYASNFSVGVNIFFALNKKLAELMRGRGYEADLREIHHTQKKDAPSGTAITLAEAILASDTEKHRWVNQHSDDRRDLVVISERTDPAPGTHIVNYRSPVDDICISHTAHNREGFALGAVMAAEFLNEHRKGIYTMENVLGIN